MKVSSHAQRVERSISPNIYKHEDKFDRRESVMVLAFKLHTRNLTNQIESGNCLVRRVSRYQPTRARKIF